MAPRAKPEANVKYTFRFRKDGKTSLVTLIYEGINNKGRLEFYNCQSKAYTSMLPDRFSYIHRFNLVKKEQIPTKEERNKVNAPKSIQVENAELKVDCAKERIDIANFFSGLNEKEKELIQRTIRRSPDKLEKDMLDFYSDSPTAPYKPGLMSEWIKAQACLKPEQAKVFM